MAYKSKYEELMDNALGRITNREKFSYDFNADPMYQMAKDQYTKLGNEAAMNAAANVSALTGGYGNSYATTAAAQANQQYLTKLNDQIPALYDAAMKRYQMEGNDLKDAYSVLSDADARDYSKYRDDVADEQWNKQFDYGKERDKVADEQWNKQFDYGKERDKVADEQWQKNFDQSLKQFEESVRQYNENFNYNKERAAVADQQWLDQFNYGKERDKVSDAQWRETFDYNKGRDSISDAQWQAQFDENNRRYNQEWTASQEAQAAAQALALARLNGGNGGGKDDGGKDDEAKALQNEINNTVAMAHQSITSANDAEYNMKALDKYLQGLVDDGKITKTEKGKIYTQFIEEEEKRGYSR